MNIQTQIKLSSSIQQYVVLTSSTRSIRTPIASLNQRIRQAVKDEWFSAKPDEVCAVTDGGTVAVLAGVEANTTARKRGQLIKTALQTKPLSFKRPIGVILDVDDAATLRGVIDGAVLGLYKWDRYITRANGAPEPEIVIQTTHENEAERWIRIAHGVNWARDLANENADVADSEFLAARMIELAESSSKASVELLNRAELREKGFGLHLAVNQGSDREPKLVIVKYQGASARKPFTALVGKGLTFDTGGLNLKPTGGIESMRMDMCGAAAVMGAMKNIVEAEAPCNAYFVCGFAENAIGPGAFKPGDVIRGYCGKSVEIGNTDAEGRLVLADANSYMARNYKPDSIVNIATLTGAVVMALGFEYAGLMSSDDRLADELLLAAETSDDRAWRLPIYPELSEHVKSAIADIKNTGLSRCAGTISAGEFLRQFAQCDDKNQKWAHLDIAGAAKPKQPVAYYESGATGYGVRLLTEFLLKRAGA
ncbi:MAG: aminopeptidase [bacterium]|nr:aminopeptidase [bacterium]